ncbi:hypothetical protein SK128_020468, partial [Halocaridina rubra]
LLFKPKFHPQDMEHDAMEASSGESGIRKELVEGEALHISCKDLEKYAVLQTYLQKIAYEGRGHVPEVTLKLAEEEVAVHATVLAALSSNWRKSLHAVDKDVKIIHTFSASVSSGHQFLSALKCLMYCGQACLSGILEEDILTAVNELSLDNVKFVHEVVDEGSFILYWEGHSTQFINGLQVLCTNQMCCDLSIFVNGHLIRGHRLVIGAYSPVLRSIFEENSKATLLHLPGVSVASAQGLLSFMYFSRANIVNSNIQEFHDLCSCLKVDGLIYITKQYCTVASKGKAKMKKNKNLVKIKILPKVKGMLMRLIEYFSVKKKPDVILLAESKKITFHKAILSATCPDLHGILKEEFIDDLAVLCLSGATYSSLRSLLSVIYSGSGLFEENHVKFISSYLDENIFEIENITDIEGKMKKKNVSQLRVSDSNILHERKNVKASALRPIVFRDSGSTRRAKYKAVKNYRKALTYFTRKEMVVEKEENKDSIDERTSGEDASEERDICKLQISPKEGISDDSVRLREICKKTTDTINYVTEKKRKPQNIKDSHHVSKLYFGHKDMGISIEFFHWPVFCRIENSLLRNRFLNVHSNLRK